MRNIKDIKNIIGLSRQNLTELTEEDLKALCHLKGFKPEELQRFNLEGNYIKNIDFIQKNTCFVNLKELYLGHNNNIADISNIQYLLNLEYLSINNLKLKDEKITLDILKTMPKLKTLSCFETFDISFKKLEKELPNIEEII